MALCPVSPFSSTVDRFFTQAVSDRVGLPIEEYRASNPKVGRQICADGREGVAVKIFGVLCHVVPLL